MYGPWECGLLVVAVAGSVGLFSEGFCVAVRSGGSGGSGGTGGRGGTVLVDVSGAP